LKRSRSIGRRAFARRQAVSELIYLLHHRAVPFTTIDQPRAL